MEKDNEAKGRGNSYDFGARIYDSRLGRWLSIDPYSHLYTPISPYSYSINNPIKFVDADGNTIYDSDGNKVVITFNTETGAINEITGTSDGRLIKVIMDTYNESKTGKTTIHELNAEDIKVQVVLSDKMGVYKDKGKFGPLYGVTLVNKDGEDGDLKFEDEGGNIFDSRIIIFNGTANRDPNNIDNFDLLDNNGYIVKDPKEKTKALKKLPSKGFTASDSETDDALNKELDASQSSTITKINKLANINRVFGNVTTLIHENVHSQQYAGKRKDRNDEAPAYKREVESYEESGRGGE